jgi:hypothetical protein
VAQVGVDELRVGIFMFVRGEKSPDALKKTCPAAGLRASRARTCILSYNFRHIQQVEVRDAQTSRAWGFTHGIARRIRPRIYFGAVDGAIVRNCGKARVKRSPFGRGRLTLGSERRATGAVLDGDYALA